MFLRKAFKSTLSLFTTLIATLLLTGCLDNILLVNGTFPDTGFSSVINNIAGGNYGFGQGRTGVGNSSPQQSTFFSSQVNADVNDANSTSTTAYIESVTPTNTGDATLTHGVNQRRGKVPSRNGASEDADLWLFEDLSGTGKLVLIQEPTPPAPSRGGTQALGIHPGIGLQGAGTTGERVAIAVAQPLEGTLTEGTYSYAGAFAWATRNDFSTVNASTVTVTIGVGPSATTFSIDGGTTGAQSATLQFTATDFSFNESTGRFDIASRNESDNPSITNGFRFGGGAASAVHFEAYGFISGTGGQTVAGIFSTIGDTASEYAGGFVAQGAQTIPVKRYAADSGGIATGSYNFVGAGSATDSYFLSGNYGQLYGLLNSPAQTTGDHFARKVFATSFAAASTGSDVVGRTRLVSGTASFQGSEISIANYSDSGRNASLLVVAGGAHPGVDTTFIAGGKAFQAVALTDTYKYVGTQLVADRAALGGATPSAIEISADFTANTFAYSTLTGQAGPVVGGTGTIARATGVLTGGSSFTVTPAGGTVSDAVTAELRGRFTGQLQGISGVLATTTATGTQYGGGFVGYLPPAATVVSATQGIATIQDFNLNSGDKYDLGVVASGGIETLVTNANAPTSRESALLASIKPAFNIASAAPGTGAGGALTLPRTTFTYSGQSVNADVFFDKNRLASLVIVHGASNSPVVSLIAAGGSDFSGTLSGSYSYGGAYIYATRSALHSTTTGNFTLTATFQGTSTTAFNFSGSTTTAGKLSSLVFNSDAGASGGASVDIADGRFTATGGFFKAGGGTAGSGDQAAVLYGVFSGLGGSSISGLFATTGSSGTQYSGGFVGAGSEDTLTLVVGNATRSGLAYSDDFSIGAGAVDGLAFVADKFSTHIAAANHASTTQRARSLAANIEPTGLGAQTAVSGASQFPEVASARKRTGGSLAFGTSSFDVTSYENIDTTARLLVLDGSDNTDTSIGSLLVAGGAARPAPATLTGAYTWEGVLVLAPSAGIASDIEEGWFRLTADFAASGNGTLTGGTADTPGRTSGTATGRTLSVGINIAAATGRITRATGAVFALHQTGQSAASGLTAGEVSGLVSGAGAQGVSGVFATSATSGTQYVGGFAGGAPLVGRNLRERTGTDGYSIGQANRSVFDGVAQGDGRIYFLFDDNAGYVAARDALNNLVSDTTRDARLLSSFNGALSGSTEIDGGLRYTGVTISYGATGTPQTKTGVTVYEDELGNARLFALADAYVAGGKALTGTLTGRYEYEGLFVSAPSTGFAAERVGTFTLDADLGAGTFTFTGVTPAGAAATPASQTSKLVVAAGNAGTISGTTGIFSATGDYTEGTGDDKTADAYIRGRAFGAGGLGVAGLFTTDETGTNYLGGFVGGSLQLVQVIEQYLLAHNDRTDSDGGLASRSREGFARSSSLVIPGGTGGTTVLLAAQSNYLFAAANSPVQATREASFLAGLGASTLTVGTSTPATPAGLPADGNIIVRAISGASHGGTNISAYTLYSDWLGAARFAIADASNLSVNPAASVLLAGGQPLEGTLTGEYSWSGYLFTSELDTDVDGDDNLSLPAGVVRSDITITADFGASEPELTFTTDTSAATKLDGNLGKGTHRGAADVINLSTGEIGTRGSLEVTSSTYSGYSTGRAATFYGNLLGDRGVGLAGVFLSPDDQDLDSSTRVGYGIAGGVVASGAFNLEYNAPFNSSHQSGRTTTQGITARGSYKVANTAATQALFALPSGSPHFYNANHPSKNVRDGALVGNLETIGGALESTAVPAVGTNNAALNLQRGQGTITVPGISAPLDVTQWRDRSGLARLVRVEGSNPLFGVAGTAPTSRPATTSGSYVWEGVQIAASTTDFANAVVGRFSLTANFTSATNVALTFAGSTPAGTGANAIPAISISNTANESVTDSSGTLFSIATARATVGGTAGAVGTINGQWHGAGFVAVSGTGILSGPAGGGSTATYALAFVGGGPQTASVTVPTGGAGNGIGVTRASIDGANADTKSEIVFVTTNISQIIDEANSPSDNVRAASLFESLDSTGTFTSTLTDIGITTKSGGSFSYSGGSVGLIVLDSGSGRLFYLDTTTQTGVPSPYAYTATAHSGGPLATGNYTWQGLHHVSGGLGQGSFQITANIASGTSGTFVYSTLSNATAFNISGNGSINATTGELVANSAGGALTYVIPGSGGNPDSTSNLTLRGELSGASGAGVVGVFIADSSPYGGFVGRGRQDVETVLTQATGHVGLGYSGTENLGGAGADATAPGIAFIADNFGGLLDVTGNASDAIRAASIIATINPQDLDAATVVPAIGNAPEARARTSINGTNASSAAGETYGVTRWQDFGGNASLLRLGGSGVTGSGSFYVAGGIARTPASVFATGAFTWAGVILYGTHNLGVAPAATAGFQLTADFGSGGEGELTSTRLQGNTAQLLRVNTVIDASTGRISNKSGTTIQWDGSSVGGALSGFVVGASAQAVSGVFASSTGFSISGGFVGGAPQVGRELIAAAVDGYAIGQANRSAFSGTDHGDGRILFLGAGYVGRRDDLNVVSDTTRNQQILSNLGDVAAGGTESGNVNVYATGNVVFGATGSTVTETAKIWENLGGDVRLYAFDDLLVVGGKALTGTLTGEFDYAGAFFTATSTDSDADFATKREGTFVLNANFGTEKFTFTGTTNEDPSDNTTTQSSRLEVTSTGAASGTLVPASGRLTAAAAEYVEGTGTTSTSSAWLEGRIFGAGGAGVGGLFTTGLSGTNYVGGFAGGVTRIASKIDTNPVYSDAEAGFAESSRLELPGGVVGPTVFFADNIQTLLTPANATTASVREASFLGELGKSGAATVAAGTAVTDVPGIIDSNVTNLTFGGKTISTRVYYDWLGVARVARASDAGLTGVEPLVIAGGEPYTVSGAALSGTYTWHGRILYGTIDALASLTGVNSTITANFGDATPELTVARTGSELRGLHGALSVDKATGVLANKATTTGGTTTSNLTFSISGTASGAAVFTGRLHGSDALAFSGVFASVGDISSANYAGAIVASGPRNLVRIAGGGHDKTLTTGLTAARGTYAINSHAAQLAYFVVPDDSSAIFDASHASDSVRAAASVTGLATIAGDVNGYSVPNREAGDTVITLGRRVSTADTNVIVYQNTPGTSNVLASLVVYGVAGNTNRLLAASGAASSGIGTSGTYTWEGAHFLGAASNLSDLTAGRFTLTANFGTGGFNYTGGTTTATDGTLTASGSVATDGVFSASSFSIAGLAGGTVTGGTLIGRLTGAGGAGVSGIFISTNDSGAKYAGGFVGGAPQVVSVTEPFGDGGGFGIANVTLDSDVTASRVVFVSSDYAALQSDANVVSDSARGGSLLDSITTTTVGTGGSITTSRVAGTSITASSGGSYSYKSGRIDLGIHEGGGAGVARLFSIDGSGLTPTATQSLFAYVAAESTGTFAAGTYTWEGVQFSGARGSLQTTKQARFRLTGPIAADGTGTLVYSTLGTSQAFTLGGNVTLGADGSLAHATATSLDFDPAGDGATTIKVQLVGTLAGASGAGLVGLFATDVAAATTHYAGGFVGAGPARAVVDAGVTLLGNAGVINGNVLFDGIAEAQALSIVARNTGNLLAGINSINNATSGVALLNSLNTVTLTGSESDAFNAAAKQQGGTISFDGSNSAVVRLQSRNEAARVLFVNAPAASAFIAAGGIGFTHAGTNTGDVSGLYTYEGAQSLAELDSDYASPVFGGFSLTIDFFSANLANATYTGEAITLGSGADAVTATLSATTAQFALEPTTGTIGGPASLAVSGGTAIPAVIRARLHGNYATAVSGVFATTGTSDTQYAGGFAGGRRTIALDPPTLFPENPASPGNNRGFAWGTATDAQGRSSGFGLFEGNIAQSVTAANNDNLPEITQVLGLNDSDHGAPITDAVSGFVYHSVDISSGARSALTIYRWSGPDDLRVAAYNSTIHPGGAVVVSGTQTSTQLAGRYSYEGALFGAFSRTTSRIGITIDFANPTTGLAIDAVVRFSLATLKGSGAVPGADGTFSATGLTWNSTSTNPATTNAGGVVYGRLYGSAGQGIAGFWRGYTGAGNAFGGFVAGGKSDVETIVTASGTRGGLGVLAERSLGAGTVNGIAVVGDFYSGLIAGTNVSNDATRGEAFLANIAPTGFGAYGDVSFDAGITNHTEGAAQTATGGTQSFGSGGDTLRATVWRNIGGQARLYYLDGSSLDDPGSAFVAGGTALPAAALTGAFTWVGALVLARSESIHFASQIGRFKLTHDFSTDDNATLEGQFLNLPGKTGTATATALTATLSIDATTGAIRKPASGGAFSLAPAGGTAFDGDIAGYVRGDTGQGVSGVFATSGTTGQQYSGGFVGGGPRLATDLLASGANRLAIGQASRAVFGSDQDAGAVLFLDDTQTGYAARREALNASSDTTRANALLSNLNATATTLGTPANLDGFRKYTLSATNKITYGTREATSGVVYEGVDGDTGVSRLLALDGFLAAGGTSLTTGISGVFQYEGVFVSAAQASLAGTLREGSFTLTATLTGAADTHDFTLEAETSTTSAGTKTVTSQLDVTAANATTINATTGVFSSTAGTYIEGSGSSGGVAAAVHGRILGVGGVGVAGLFTTTAGSAVYAGGFAGGLTSLATRYEIAPGFNAPNPADTAAGFATSSRIRIPGAPTTGATILFAAANLGSILEAANSSVTATRDGALLSAINRRFTYHPSQPEVLSDTPGVFGNRVATWPDVTTSVRPNIDLAVSWNGTARYAHVKNTGEGLSSTSTAPLFIVGGTPLTGTPLTGDYTWHGRVIYGDVTTLSTVTANTTTITADFDLPTPVLTLTRPASPTNTGPAGTLSVNVTTGVLSSQALKHYQTSGGTGVDAVFAGRLHGADAGALAGIFATTNASGAKYAGALVASGVIAVSPPLFARHGETAATTGGSVGAGNFAINHHGAQQHAIFLAPVGSPAFVEVNHASKTIRDAALIVQLASPGTKGAGYTALDIGKRVADDGDYGGVRSKTETLSYGGAAPVATIYQDTAGLASLINVGGAANTDRLLVAGAEASPAAAALNALNGTYTWEGVQFVGDGADFSSLEQGRFILTTTFVAGATSQSLTYDGGKTGGGIVVRLTHGVVRKATGRFSSTYFGNTLTTAAGRTFDVNLYGRIAGTNLDAVSGVFAARDGVADGADNWAGGFVGGGLQAATATQRFGTDDANGFGQASLAIDGAAAGAESDLVFVARGIDTLLQEINVASQNLRESSVLGALDSTQGGGSVTTGIGGIAITTGRSYDSRGDAIGVGVFESGPADARDARLLRVATSNARGVGSPFIYTAKASGAALATGTYTWQGVHLYNTSQGEFQITANVAGTATDSFSYSTLNRETGDANIAGTGVFNTLTGAFSASGTAITLTPGGGSAQNLALRGQIGGTSGAAIVGVFGTETGTAGTATIGGFIGTGKQEVETLLGATTGHVGLGYVDDQNLDSANATADGIVFIGDAYGDLLNVTGAARDATRAAAIIATIDPALGTVTAATITNAGEAVAQTSTGTNPSSVDGQSYNVIKWQDTGDIASLLRLDGTGVDNSGSFYVAGGTVRPNSTAYTGAVTWAGALVYGARTIVDAGGAAPLLSSFQLTADFGSDGAGVFTGTVTGGALRVLTKIDSTTGRISRRADATQIAIGAGNVGGDISGFVSGATAQAVSGVFTTTTGTTVAGGFVGGAPQVGRNVAVATNTGYSIGEANRSVFSGSPDGTGRLLFLSNSTASYNALRDDLNVIQDATRDLQRLSNLDTALTTGTLSGLVTAYSGQSFSHGEPATSASAAVWEDVGKNAKLFAFADLYVAGGKALSGTLAGTFEYAGTFVSAPSNAFGTERVGSFELEANFTAGSFTFTGTTRATPSDSSSDQTSKLEVKTSDPAANRTIDASTGRFTATAATYIEGAGTSKTADARIEGRFLGASGFSVTGLFTTDNTSVPNYAGGFVGAISSLVVRHETTPDYDGNTPGLTAAGFASSSRLRVPGASSIGPAYLFAAANLGHLLAEVNSATSETSTGSLLYQAANPAGVTVSTGTVRTDTPIVDASVSGVSYKTNTVTINVQRDVFGIARFAHVLDTGLTGNAKAPVLLAGGDAFSITGARLTGNYNWVGRVLANPIANLGGTTQGTTAHIAANFGLPTPILTVTRPSGVQVGLGGTLDVDSSTGVITNKALQYSNGIGNSQISNVVFAGRLHGENAASISGVFASTGNVNGAKWAGALVATGRIGLEILAGGAYGKTVPGGATGGPQIAAGNYAINHHPGNERVVVLAPVGSPAIAEANHASADQRASGLLGSLAT